MAQFSFRLQSIVEYRQQLLEKLQQEMALLQARYRAADERLRELEAAERATLGRLGEGQADVLDLAEVLQATAQLERLQLLIGEQTATLQQVQAEISILQDRLVEQSRDVKALEKLRERQAADHAREERRVEQLEASELGLRQHRRMQVVC